jgi:hypothetical protein
MNETTRTIIPATPGWFVGILQFGDNCEFLDYEYIIAWSIEYGDNRYRVVPITIDGEVENYDKHLGHVWATRRPDTTLEFGGGKYKTEEEVTTMMMSWLNS